MRLRRPLIALALALPFGLLAGLVAAGTASSADALVGQGRQLFVTGCASCHGLDAHGIAGSGPSLVGVGAQAADFYLSTGRMPLAAPSDAPMRKPPAYSQTRIAALTAYIGSLGGPPVPTVGAHTRSGRRHARLHGLVRRMPRRARARRRRDGRRGAVPARCDAAPDRRGHPRRPVSDARTSRGARSTMPRRPIDRRATSSPPGTRTIAAAGASATSGRCPKAWSRGCSRAASLLLVARVLGERSEDA